jgi:hypothetical protein
MGGWTLLAALAAVTQRVRLGPLVACASFHPPGLIAKMAATIDEVSGGRFVLGLGAGWNETEYRAFGLPYDHRVSRFEESFGIVRRLVAGERATLAGRFWQGEGAAAPAVSARSADDRLAGRAVAPDHAPSRRLVELLVLLVREHGRGLWSAERSDLGSGGASGPRPGYHRPQRVRAG